MIRYVIRKGDKNTRPLFLSLITSTNSVYLINSDGTISYLTKKMECCPDHSRKATTIQ